MVSFLAVLTELFCWNLEVKSCFYLVNAIQVIYSFTILKIYRVQNRAETKGTKTALLFGAELLLTVGAAVIYQSKKTECIKL